MPPCMIHLMLEQPLQLQALGCLCSAMDTDPSGGSKALSLIN